MGGLRIISLEDGTTPLNSFGGFMSIGGKLGKRVLQVSCRRTILRSMDKTALIARTTWQRRQIDSVGVPFHRVKKPRKNGCFVRYLQRMC